MAKSLITCSCLGSQSVDAEALSETTGLDVRPPCSELCMGQIDLAAEAISSGNTILACTQEARRFEALAEELGMQMPPVLDLRDRAGWSADEASNVPKMSALIAEALLPATPEKTREVVSEGLCLILGQADVAISAAEQLKDHLGVTVLLSDAPEIPETREFEVVVGQLRRATGSLGAFEVKIDALQQVTPGGRGSLTLTPPRDGGTSHCDIMLDLRGDTALFPAHEKRDGYLRADPRPSAVCRRRCFGRIAFDRDVRETALCPHRSSFVRPFSRRTIWLHPLLGFVSHRGHHQQRRSCRCRSNDLCWLRCLFRYLPLRGDLV